MAEEEKKKRGRPRKYEPQKPKYCGSCYYGKEYQLNPKYGTQQRWCNLYAGFCRDVGHSQCMYVRKGGNFDTIFPIMFKNGEAL